MRGSGLIILRNEYTVPPFPIKVQMIDSDSRFQSWVTISIVSVAIYECNKKLHEKQVGFFDTCPLNVALLYD